VTHAGSHDNAPVLLTVAEAAEFLRTPVATLRYWRHLGVGPTGFRLGRRVVYSRADLISWLAQKREAEASR
jgi:DNA-binding transcriptional MerR regulator